MLASIERAAADDRAVCLFFLTTTVEAFFRRHGYGQTDRTYTPVAITGSAEFRSPCAASAAFLSKRIT